MTNTLKKIDLIVIDPQNDFCDPNGALSVVGADRDMRNLAAFLDRIGGKVNEVHVTMDSHNVIDVGHPPFWMDEQGNQPAPFTIISHDDVVTGKWTPRNPAWRQRMLDYTATLEANGRYPLCVWTIHCVIGTWGHSIFPVFSDALVKWQENEFATVDFVTKGSNIFTEHYSAVQADVPDPNDPSTMLNTRLIQTLQNVDEILITGQALSHCVANTIIDIANNFGEDNIKKFVLLEDTCSNVTGFENLGQDFVRDMTARGMRVTKSTDYLAAA